MEKKYQDLKNQIEETVKKELDFEKYGFIRDYKKEEREYKNNENYKNTFLDIGVYTFWFKYKGLSISFTSDHREILDRLKGCNGYIVLEYDPKIFTTVGTFFPELLQSRPKIFKIRDTYHNLDIITNDTLKEYAKALDEVLDIINKSNEKIKELEKNSSVKIYSHNGKYYTTTYKVEASPCEWWLNRTLPLEVKSKYQEIKLTNSKITSIKKKTKIPVEIIELKPQA